MESPFDIVMRDDDFVLYKNGLPHHTALGNEVSHSNARLLRLCINHEISSLPGKNIPLQLLEKNADFHSLSGNISGFSVEEEIKKDPLLPGGDFSTFNRQGEIFENDPDLLDFIFLNASTLASSRKAFFSGKEGNQSEKNYLIQVIREFPPEKQTVLNTLSLENGSGLIIHCLLMNENLSMTEYGAGLIILRLKNGSPEALTSLNDKSKFSALLEQIILETLPAIDFLTLCKSENRISVIEEIIKRGENNQTEFKSTLRWDIRQGIKSPAIEHASLKTVCAFLNSEGGELMIGVRDDGNIEGIETDQFDNDDRFLLHLWTLVKTCIGQEVVEWVNTSLQKFGNKTVCRVSCRKSRIPVFLRQKGFEEAFFIRVGPSTNSLEISTALKYIKQHF